MKELRIIFDLTAEQKMLVDDLYDGEGECYCGAKIANGKPRALLAMPGSHKSTNIPGQFAVRAFCAECFELIQERLKHIKARQRFPAAAKV